MKTHISLNVRDVRTSVEFYQRVFGITPQKHTDDYAKFDLTNPPLNFSLVSRPDISRVNHLGIEVESTTDLDIWEGRLQELGLVDLIENDADCCFAKQNKVWFTDPDGIQWEVFTVLEQLPVTTPLKDTGCCLHATASPNNPACGCSRRIKQ